MSNGIYAALSGAVAAEEAMDVLAHNMANLGTTGFKGDRITFKEVLLGEQSGEQNSNQRHVSVDEVKPDFSQGSLRKTGNTLDLALEGDGFFAVQTADGERYTRAGAFSLDGNGTIINRSGDAVLGQNGPIVVDTLLPLTIDEQGRVYNGEILRDTFKIVKFGPNAEPLREGDSLWRVPQEQLELDGASTVRVGSLELSNVSALTTMTQLITVSRAYEGYHRAIDAFRSIDSRTVNTMGQ